MTHAFLSSKTVSHIVVSTSHMIHAAHFEYHAIYIMFNSHYGLVWNQRRGYAPCAWSKSLGLTHYKLSPSHPCGLHSCQHNQSILQPHMRRYACVLAYTVAKHIFTFIRLLNVYTHTHTCITHGKGFVCILWDFLKLRWIQTCLWLEVSLIFESLFVPVDSSICIFSYFKILFCYYCYYYYYVIIIIVITILLLLL